MSEDNTVDKEDNAVETEVNAVNSVGVGLEGIELTPKGLAMVDVAVAAEMLHAYALNTIHQEVPDQVDAVREGIIDLLKEAGQFDLNVLKFRMFDVLQIVMTNIAQISFESQAMQAKAESEASALEGLNSKEQSPAPVLMDIKAED